MAERIKFGTTWWGKAWLEALSNIDYSNRLPRGRSYYGRGMIESVEFHPDTLTVEALVSGSAYYPYEVKIQLTRIPEKDVERLVDAIAERPPLVAKLLNRELDPEVAEIAQRLGIRLFPSSWREFRMSCSCPDSAVPCKHLAAVYYAIVKTIDADPMWVFTCRGVDLTARLKSRGINLESAVRIEDPRWRDWLNTDGESQLEAAVDESADFSSLPYWRLRPLTSVLMPLLPASTGPRKELTRAKTERLYGAVSKWASEVLSERTLSDSAWHDWESTLPGGSVMPKLVFEAGRPRLIVIKCRGKKEQRLSPGQHQVMIEALFSTGTDEACAHSPSLGFWSGAAGAAAALLKQGAAVPVLVCEGEEEDAVGVVWLPAVQSPEVSDLVDALAAVLERCDIKPFEQFDCSSTSRGRALTVLGTLMTEAVQASQPLRMPATSSAKLWSVVCRPQQSLVIGVDDEEIQAIRRFLKPLSLGQRSFVWTPVLTVRTGREDDVTLNLGLLPKKAGAAERPMLYRDVLKSERYADERFAVISVFESFADVCPELRTVIETGGSPAHLPLESLKEFLFSAVPSLEMLGARVMLPKSLQKMLRPSMKAKIGASGSGKSVLTKEALADFSWEMSVGGHPISEEEFKALLEDSGRIVRWKDEFVYLDPEVLARMKAALEAEKNPSHLEKLRAMLSGEYAGMPVEISADLTERIKALSEVAQVPLPAGLKAVLRPYQERGYAWLTKNIRLGIGALIADDMGLGKTLQVISALLEMKEKGEFEDGKVLAAVPATLLTNWEREVRRFAPSLSVSVYHGTGRRLAPLSERADITLTTYGTLRRDVKKLSGENWRVLVIDEAQAVKNSGTGVTQAVRSLPVRQVIAMSGTPVENRLAEYWSLLSIVQPGLLGSEEEFRRTFALPIESDHDPKALEAFRRLTAPFMLRRLKTDKSIIADLPEKLVSDRYTGLTPEQAALYQQTLERLIKKVTDAEAEQDKSKRSAAVLELITALKQICNSPSQYQKTHTPVPDSGKGTALLELIGECRENRRKVLIFTQYREMGERLQEWIARAFGRRPDFLHGGIPVSARAEMVDAFQTDPSDDILIISLKAGGTGLNLTAASAVVHYDLWWNPAVENQATDRAYRIGQTRDVLVYRFLCAGTFEEKINEMLAQKRELADLTVVTGENWIGDMSAAELSAVFRLEKA
ncbi:MAG: DEAD/DEAH box helicase [Sutterella sp.]|nr:DEAD/DEAH box helicase [Sutterella sp.]